MSPDEHEARLRDAVLREVDELIIDGIDHGNLPWKYERPNADAVVPALTAYADWLRLRERAQYGCRPEYHDGSLMFDEACPGHAAQQQIAAILGGASCQNPAHYGAHEHALCADEFHRCDGGPPGEAARYNPQLHQPDGSPCHR